MAIISGTSGDDNLVGTVDSDSIDGGQGNDSLDGSSNADILVGGPDNDVYSIDDPNDVIVEMAGDGFDQAYSSVSYTLGSGAEVEVLAADDPSGTAALVLTGNGFANRLVGNAGANGLYGGGGADSF